MLFRSIDTERNTESPWFASCLAQIYEAEGLFDLAAVQLSAHFMKSQHRSERIGYSKSSIWQGLRANRPRSSVLTKVRPTLSPPE